MPSKRGGSTARRGRRSSVRERLGTALWPIPVGITAAAVLAGFLLPLLDETVDAALPPLLRRMLFGGGAIEARQLLSSITSGLITTVSLVFSLTVVVFQLASSQHSPRLLRVFPRDTMVRVTLGVLVGAFVYSLTVLRTVRQNAVPRIAVSFAFVLTVSGAVLLVVFLGHLVTELRIETMLRRVHREQDRVEADLLATATDGVDDHPDDGPPAGRYVAAPRSGFLTAVDEAELLATAVRDGVLVRLLQPVGRPVTAGTPIAAYHRVRGDEQPDHERLRADVVDALVVGYERTSTQDLGYGIQQMVDIYVKALSPGINDPTTALSALGHLAGTLATLSSRDLGPRRLCDADGTVRLIVPVPTFDQLVEDALGPARTFGSADPAVVCRVLDVLRDLAWLAPDDEHRATVRAQLRRMGEAAGRGLSGEDDLAAVRTARRRVEAALDGRWE